MKFNKRMAVAFLVGYGITLIMFQSNLVISLIRIDAGLFATILGGLATGMEK